MDDNTAVRLLAFQRDLLALQRALEGDSAPRAIARFEWDGVFQITLDALRVPEDGDKVGNIVGHRGSFLRGLKEVRRDEKGKIRELFETLLYHHGQIPGNQEADVPPSRVGKADPSETQSRDVESSINRIVDGFE